MYKGVCIGVPLFWESTISEKNLLTRRLSRAHRRVQASLEVPARSAGLQEGLGSGLGLKVGGVLSGIKREVEGAGVEFPTYGILRTKQVSLGFNSKFVALCN